MPLSTTIDPVVLKTPFGRGLAVGMGVGDGTADGLAVRVALGAADTPAEGLAVPPPQPETARATIPLASSRFAARKRGLLDIDIANLDRPHPGVSPSDPCLAGTLAML